MVGVGKLCFINSPARMDPVPLHAHTAYKDAGKSRAEFDADLAARVAAHSPDVIVLAGWMLILSPAFLGGFGGLCVAWPAAGEGLGARVLVAVAPRVRVRVRAVGGVHATASLVVVGGCVRGA